MARTRLFLRRMVPVHVAVTVLSLLSGQAPDAPVFPPVDIAEPLPRAFSVATGDVTGDGRPDVLIGAAGSVTLLSMDSDGHFGPGRPIPTGCAVSKLALSDFDRDGLPDLAAYCPGSGQVLTYRGDGQGNFSKVSEIALKVTTARGMACADLNQDGTPDLAVGQPGGVVILFGNGDLSFRLAEGRLDIAAPANSAQPVSIVAADFNGDGIPDLATANPVYPDRGSLFLGTGGGSFSAEMGIDSQGRPMNLTAADLNRDGRMDLVFACQGGLTILTGRGDGSFDPGALISIPASAMSVAASDLDGDGDVDLVVGGYYGGVISVFLNKGDGTFGPPNTVWSIGDVFGVALADLNGDSIPDLVAASYSGDSALYAQGAGNGDFESPAYFGTYPTNTFPLLTSDLDADGAADLAVVSERRKTITILRQGLSTVAWTWWREFPVDAVFGDFNGDGIPDLLVATLRAWQDVPGADRGAALQFLRGLGDGTFDGGKQTAIEKCPVFQGVYYSTVGRMISLTPGDFNGDGILDLAVGNEPLNELQLYLGNGDGTLRFLQSLPVNSFLFATGDFNGDGVQDLAIGAPSYYQDSPSTVTLHSGSREEGLRAAEKYGVCAGDFPRRLISLRAGDFDGDGRTDLAVSCGTGITVLHNTGDGRFQTIPVPPIEPDRFLSGPLHVADFDGNGSDDIVATSVNRIGSALTSAPLLLLLPGNSDGSLGPPLAMSAPAGVSSMAVGDFDGDRRLEFALMDTLEGKLKVLRGAFEARQAP